MPSFGYSFQEYDPLIHVKASAREVDVSPKAAREVCKAIKGKRVDKARAFLERVIEKKQAVPFRRYKKEIPHRSSTQGFPSGRYPVKVAQHLLELLDNLEANAEFKGMDIGRLVIVHAAAYGGRKVRNFIPRAFGRATPSFNTLTHIEVVAKEEV